MKLKLFLTVSLLVWLIAIFGYVHGWMRTADAAEPLAFDRATATKRLRAAAIEGWSKMAETAIHCGAAVDDADEYGTTPLILAAVRGHDPIVRLLLDAGADVNHQNDDRLSAIFGASANCNDPVISLLLRRGANPNAKNLTRQTPLMRAAENGCAVAVKELLKAKRIDLLVADDSGRTALDYARESSVLGLDNGETFATLDGVRREAGRRRREPKVYRRPPGLPRGTSVPRLVEWPPSNPAVPVPIFD